MEEDRLGYHDEDISGIVERFERMRKNNENYFFDVAEFESIIDYYLENNDIGIAYEASESASRQHPGSVSLQLRRAKVMIDKGRGVEALKAIKLVESVEPDNFEVYIIKGAALGLLGDINGARRCFDLALTIDESEESTILFSITSILYNLNHYKVLIPYLHRLVDLEPEQLAHLYDLAYSYEKIEEYESSIKYYRMYVDQAPFADNAWYNLGILYNKTNRPGEAIEAYDFSLAINPDNFFALFNRANILFNTGRYNEALKSYLEYIEEEEDSPEALTYIGECYFKQHDHQQAARYYREAIEYDAGFAEPWFGLGNLYMEQNKKNEALYYLRRAVDLEEENPEYHYYLGLALQKFVDNKSAMRSYMTALRLDPFYDTVWVEIGSMIVSENLTGRVIPMLERALKVIGDVHGLRFVLAAAYLHSGAPGKAYYHLTRAMILAEADTTEFNPLFPDHLLSEEMRQLFN